MSRPQDVFYVHHAAVAVERTADITVTVSSIRFLFSVSYSMPFCKELPFNLFKEV